MQQVFFNYYYLFCVLLIFEITGIDISLYRSIINAKNNSEIENLQIRKIQELLFTGLILIDLLALIIYLHELLIKRKNFITIEICVLISYLTVRFILLPQYAPEQFQMERYISIIRTILTIIFLFVSFLISYTFKKFFEKPDIISII